MNIKEIRQLVKLMVDNDLTEIDLGNGEDKVAIKRGPGDVPVVTTAPVAAQQVLAGVAAPPAVAESPEDEPADGLVEIKSPMVGTFYAAPSSDSDPYVQVGAGVGDESVVCIVEAMKVMNEIKAECSGIIVETCVKNAQPVEFGQPLFRVKPS